MATSNLGGSDDSRWATLTAAVEGDIAAGLYFGGNILVSQGGKALYGRSFGHSAEDKKRPVAPDSVFSLFSVTKALTNMLVFRAIEKGQLTLTTPVHRIIPEFSGGLRNRVTFFHLLTHSTGIPSIYCPRPGMYIDQLDEIIKAICEVAYPLEQPGSRVDYSPMVNHALMGEAVRRLDPAKRSYRQIMAEDLFGPLGMKDTSMGVRRDLKARHLVPEFRGNYPISHLGHSNLGPNGAFEEEHAEMPWVGCVSTAPDMLRFTEMLRQGGTLDGHRLVSKSLVDAARTIHTGDKPNEFYASLIRANNGIVLPGNLGLGFSIRGAGIGTSMFGTLASPGTFGAHGAGTTLFWVDPTRDLSFVGLMTGLMTTYDNLERWQRLCDLAILAACG